MGISCWTSTFVFSQSEFNINLILDYSSAEQYISLCDDQPINTQQLAALRGNKIAASTTGLISNQNNVTNNLVKYLDSLKYHQKIVNDVYRLEETRANISKIKELFEVMQNRNFSRRVSATVEQIFPNDANITVDIPVYVVAIGHKNVDAYVRRIIWHGDIPEFVGENMGELTIILNLSQAINYGNNTDDRFINLLGVVAHEVFHSAFGKLKESSPVWQKYYSQFHSPVDALLALTHNEGIAYYLSLEQQSNGYLPRDWKEKTDNALSIFNSKTNLLFSDTLSPRTVSEIIKQANLNGYWESYGSISGMFMAREIDRQLGRNILIESIGNNPFYFFKKYVEICQQNSNLPRLTNRLIRYILKNSE